MLSSRGKSPNMKSLPGDFPLVVPAEGRKSADHYDFEGNAVCIPLISSSGHGKADIKRLHYQEGKFALADTMCCAIPKDENELNAKFVYKILEYKMYKILVPMMKGATNVSMNVSDVSKVKIPKPPIEVQNDIVSCDNYEAVIDGAKKIQDNFIIRPGCDEELMFIDTIKKLIGRMKKKLDSTMSIAEVWGE